MNRVKALSLIKRHCRASEKFPNTKYPANILTDRCSVTENPTNNFVIRTRVCCVISGLINCIKTEFTRSTSNTWTKTLYQNYLHRIANFATTVLNIFSKRKKIIISSSTKRRKQMLNFVWITWKYWWNETDDEILPVFEQFLSLTFEICFLSFPRETVFGVISGNYLHL